MNLHNTKIVLAGMEIEHLGDLQSYNSSTQSPGGHIVFEFSVRETEAEAERFHDLTRCFEIPLKLVDTTSGLECCLIADLLFLYRIFPGTVGLKIWVDLPQIRKAAYVSPSGVRRVFEFEKLL